MSSLIISKYQLLRLGRWALSTLLTIAYCSSLSASPLSPAPDKILAYYFATWSENDQNQEASQSVLAHLPSSLNMIMLAFAKPGAIYKGDGDLEKTGLDYNGEILKGSIQLLKSRNPNLKILLSVGGWEANWKKINYLDLARIISDYGLDGVDIDYEPPTANCKSTAEGAVDCPLTDGVYIDLIRQFRAALPRPLIVSIAGWSNGAYGLNEFKTSKPMDTYSGLLINPIRQVGDQLDQINIMSYNGGHEYSPVDALRAYQSVFNGPILVGLQAPPEYRNHVITVEELHQISAGVTNLNGAGMMVWAPWNNAKKFGIDAKVLLSNICHDFGMNSCEME